YPDANIRGATSATHNPIRLKLFCVLFFMLVSVFLYRDVSWAVQVGNEKPSNQNAGACSSTCCRIAQRLRARALNTHRRHLRSRRWRCPALRRLLFQWLPLGVPRPRERKCSHHIASSRPPPGL